ncbi:glucose-6-phosphate dehydrogenase [Gaoshiqia sediminis]|uniref:Glucose-6-phosphate 1-dehydrogenase n=1 Tax=Gaoshiqia sediminis TaxID=2986998 RepID=A0AA41Y4X6_9BACT|nr:glucose-6-phosphate dehydrogenase [Gaoshiqia sediminis]MCW0481989.1 glucose-6-phosphate dehydrogenase [Gaoshiqia sediminis]
MNHTKPHILVIFGASGDLTKRKLIPALFDLYKQKLLPAQFAVLGVSRTELSDEEFRNRMTEFLPEEETHQSVVEEFLPKLYYQPLATDDGYEYPILRDRLATIAKQNVIAENYIFYLSTPPKLYDVIPANLASVELNKSDDGFRRLIVEKPFGTDLASAKKLNKKLLHYFDEDQIYRIDHYLGKESVQNMLVTRFANGIFEPIWNHNFIQHVEITSAESLGVEERGGYYDQSGAMRDMVQNHLMQLVGMVAMEPPVVIEADAIRNEVLKVFQSLRPIKEDDVASQVIRGQYTESHIKKELVKGYRQEKGVNPESRTETFFAMKFFIDNWRWSGVPFYIRTGKKLPTRVTEVVIHFKKTPHHLFGTSQASQQTSNQLIIRIQPDEGILLKFGMKVPGAGFRVQTVNMDFHYDDLADTHLPSAYERLLLDCMQGDATLYSRGDAVEKAWAYVQPILDAWQNNPDIPVYGYPAGTWGPEVTDKLIEGGSWRYPCKNLSDDGNYCEL